jgi:pimeloyl-ACP methyl ester carboxylesterase
MDLFPQTLDLDLGEGCFVDVLQHPEHVTGTTPAMVFLHGGGGIVGDRRAIWPDGGSMNRFATHLFGSSESSFDVISLGLPQFANQGHSQSGHLTPIVATPTGVTYPESFDKLSYSLDRIIELLQPGPIVLAGASYGAIQCGVQMLKVPLPIVGLIGYYLIPDVRSTGGVDAMHWSALPGLFGTTTQAAWNAVPVTKKREASFRWYIDRGQIANARPIYAIFERIGDHIKPYGDPARPGSRIHDGAQLGTLVQSLAAAGLPHESELLPSQGAWETPEFGDPLSARVESWMISLL